MAGEGSLIDQVRRREEQRRQARAEARAEQTPETGQNPPAADGEAAKPPGEDEVNEVAFGYYRGVGDRAAYIEFQRLEGTWPAAGYAWLPSPVWAPTGVNGNNRGQAIVLEYMTGLKVVIWGRNLRPLHERILRQQVFRVTEMGEESDKFLPEDATVVYAIGVTEPVEDKP